MTLAEPVQITRSIAVVFEKLEIPYYVVGSLASSFHGIPRATADVDLMADIKEQLPKKKSPTGAELLAALEASKKPSAIEEALSADQSVSPKAPEH